MNSNNFNISPPARSITGANPTFPYFTVSNGDANNANTSAPTILRNIQLLDSVHDFGGSRGGNLAEDSINRNWSSAGMMYSLIKRNSFRVNNNNNTITQADLAAVPSSNFSHYSYPGAGQHQYVVNDIENYLMYSSISTANQNNFRYIRVDTADINSLYRTKQEIREFFNNIRNPPVQNPPVDVVPAAAGSGKINILVDTPGHFSKVLRCDRINERPPNILPIDDFAYVLTKESIYDSMRGKPTPMTPLIIDEVYRGNGFIETFPINGQGGNIPRTYIPGTNAANSFESNFNINLGTIQYTPGPAERFNLTATFTDTLGRQMAPVPNTLNCVLNSFDHITSVPVIIRAVKTIITANTANNAFNLGQQPNVPVIDNTYNNNFYNSNNNAYNNTNIDLRFTSKRAGDGLQVKCCQVSSQQAIPCYKKRNENQVGNVTAGVATNTTYNLRNLVFCTIDRPAFSYAVKNGVPAIFSGENYFILYNANAPPIGEGLAAQVVGGPAPVAAAVAVAAAAAAQGQGQGQGQRRRPPTPTRRGGVGGQSTTEKYSNFDNENANYQKGGAIIHLWNAIQNIPYIMFKLLPHALGVIINGRTWFSPGVALRRAKMYLENTTDDIVITNYENVNKVYLTLKNNNININNGANLDNMNLGQNWIPIFYFGNDHYLKYNGNGNQYIYHYVIPNIYNIDEPINVGIFTSLLNSQSGGAITRSVIANGWFGRQSVQHNLQDANPDPNANRNANEYAVATHIDNGLLQYFTNPQDTNRDMGGGGEENSKNILDIYIDFLINDIKQCCDKDNLASNNFTVLISYFCMLSNYEVSLCFDNELYEQHFHEKNGLSVTKNIGMYIMFYMLLNDFIEQKDKIYYGLLEYFINLGTSAYKYIAISTDLLELIQYVYCDDVRMDEALFRKIETQIANGEIKTDDPIFIATQQYVDDLFVRISAETAKIDDYLVGKIDDVETKEFIQSKLSMYGFLNMTSDFFDKYNKPQEESIESEEQINVETPYNYDNLKDKMGEAMWSINPFNSNPIASFGGEKTKRIRKKKRRHIKTRKTNKKSNKKHNSKRGSKRMKHKKTRRNR
jgi:hypothetical protein